MSPHQEILGIIISATGEVEHGFALAKASLWKSFFGSATRKRLKGLTDDKKTELLNQHLFAHLAFRGTAWPPTRKTYDGVDALQRRMLCALIRTPRLHGEVDAAYHARRNHIASTIANRHLRWSDRLLLRAHSWQQHLDRGHVTSPATLHAQQKHEAYLQRLRFDYISVHGTQSDTLSTAAGRFGRRLARGRPPMRWGDGLAKSIDRYKEVLEKKNDERKKMRAKSCQKLDSRGHIKQVY